MRASYLHYGRAWLLAGMAAMAGFGQQLISSTYLDGSSSDVVTAMAVGRDGSLYLAGYTYSADFPVTAGVLQTKHAGVPGDSFMIGDTHAADAFVTKMSADGKQILWSTLLGGAKHDFANAIAVDAAGNVLVAGSTASEDFPVTAGAWQTKANYGLTQNTHGFVAKIAADGKKLVWSTLLAGRDADGVTGMALDGAGGAYVTGWTTSFDFPTTPGAWQRVGPAGSDGLMGVRHGFVTRVAPDGSALVYSTFLSGTKGSSPAGIARSGDGSVVVAGVTGSHDFPITAGAQQSTFIDQQSGFVTKLDASGTAVVWSTFTGGDRATASAVALGPDDAVTVVGEQRSQSYAARYGKDGKFQWLSTVELMLPAGVAVDGAGNAWVAGLSGSAGNSPYRMAPCYFATHSPFADTTYVIGCSDAAFAKVDAAGKAEAPQYYGGSGLDSAAAIAVDAAGTVVVAGNTASANLAVTAGAAQPAMARKVCSYWGSPTAQSADVCEAGFVAKFGAAAAGLQVVHGGSRLPGPVAADELVRLVDSRIVKDDNGTVLFDEAAAPVLASAAGEALVAVPGSIVGRSRVTVKFQGWSTVVDIGAAVPSLFAGVVNADGTVNEEANPAKRGAVVAVWGTGIAGEVVQAWVGGKLAEVTYAGPAPGMVRGVQQVNFRVPEGVAGAVPLFVSTGALMVTSQGGVGLVVER